MLHLYLIIAIIIAMLTIRISVYKYGFWLNHYTLHNMFWLMTLVLALYFSNYQFPVKESIYYIIISGLICFNLTIFFVPKYKIVQPKAFELNLKIRRIVELIIFVSIVPQAYINFLLLREGVDLWAINTNYWESRGDGLYLYNLFQQSVVAPLSNVLIATCFYNKYRDAKPYSYIITIAIAIAIGILSMFVSGGGRTGILQLGFMLTLSCLAFYNRNFNRQIVHIKIKYLIALLIICVSGIAWATFNRGHDSFMKELVDRYTLCIPLLEYYYYSPILDEHTFGASMFEFFWTLINYPLGFFNLSADIVRNNSIIQEMVYLPAFGRSYNAYPTEYFNYIRDFGLWGVVIGPVILAYIYNWLYKHLRGNLFYLLFFVVGVLSWNLESHFAFLRTNCLSIIYCIILYKVSRWSFQS